ncbi:M23 family metallopeptidase [Sphingomonas sp. KC8]|uniref:M23 family metallopeptidase n=1 Tax=Sphingomonas sp. KC8 TaxID=1030157 RepID=UPI0002488AEE|nr:M23 family metallopeptidase [Sphingomonas sp. KC8]ARS27952.1 peptidase M23 [Sphingomonas sp. KC8]
MVRRCAFVLRALSIVMLAGCASRLPAAPPAKAVSVCPAAGFNFQGAFQQGGLVLGTAPEGTVSLFLDGQPLRMAKGRSFLLGFGRDHRANAVIEARLADGSVQRLPITIAARVWDIQSLPTLPRGTTPTPEFLKRRAAELAQINAARTIQSDSQGWRQAFVWPVIGRISGVFGSQRIYAGEPGAPHSGVDVARPTGTPVVAPADGVVILAAAAPFSLEGNLLMIDHGMGLNSAFLHLSRIDVKVGDRVARGQRVGAIGATGRATGPHLHWSMKWQDERIDPAPLAGAMPAQ